ncbi:MAG: ATP-binding protein [Anaerolineae bacterium]|nr:ATP-binding protein [Anaerolineae bacterium]
MIVLDLRIVLFFFLLFTGVFAFLLTSYLQRFRRPAYNFKGSFFEVLKVAPFGVMLLEDTNLLFTNAYALSLLHLTTEMTTLPDTDWLHVLQEDCRAAHQLTSGHNRYRVITFASGLTARWWVIPFNNQNIVFILDITNQIHAQQSSKALVNDLGHELRTPVATILTHLEILGLENVGDDVRQQSLELARNETRRMGRLLNEMLELGRLEVSDELPLRPFAILPLVNEVILQTTPQAHAAGIELSLDADTQIPLVMGNVDRIRQVFLNLVDNAIKYAHGVGSITIKIRMQQNGVHCSVCDLGPGIPVEHQPYITRRFYRVPQQKVEGSGLGLALVAEILRRHNSHLDIESPVQDGKGTCMHFTLPFTTGRVTQ